MNNRMGAASMSGGPVNAGPGVTSQAAAMQQASSSGNMNPSMSPSMQPSPSHLNNPLGSPHQPGGLGGKPGAQTPPANVLQVVKQVSLTTNPRPVPAYSPAWPLQVQEEAARQQVPHVTGFGKVSPAGPGKMPPPVIQRPITGHMVAANQNLQSQQGNVSNMGNAGVSGNLQPMDQWGGNRFPSTSVGQTGNQVIRPNNPMQMMPQNQMQQPVS